jgi:hypothetical protein
MTAEKNNPLLSSFIEVKLPKSDSFNVVRETLTRIGVINRKTATLYPSCLILHKKGKYYIVHFKEMFLLDGKDTTFDENDRLRRNAIANLLKEWGLVEVITESMIEERAPTNEIKVVPFKDKSKWNIVQKYTVGK